MRLLAIRFAAALFALAALPAAAAFHVYSISEIYSNASGTVQFVEMTALSGGQQFVGGHALKITGGATFTVPSNLPGDTAGHKVLFGTAGVMGAFGIAPDYIIPNGFLPIGGGTVVWDANFDMVTFGPLPTNGNSINRSGVEGAPTPQNFPTTGVGGGGGGGGGGPPGGGGGGPPVSTTPAYQGMWWASPANSEAGWGINTAHQGNTIFATWFTYGADGNGLWLILSNAAKTSDGKYSGDIFTVTGPAFDSVPFDPRQVVATKVGTGTFTFASPTTGTFEYTVNGITQSKSIIRYEFGASIPTCIAGGTAGTIANFQDIWWKSPASSEAGWGLNITHQGDQMFLTWFTYDAAGKAQWLVMPEFRRVGLSDSFSGPIFRTRGNPFNSTPWSVGSVSSTQVGTATLAFTSRDNATFTYTLDGVTQTKAITRTIFDANGAQTACNY